MKILVVTDAWRPQVNGVVRTLSHMAHEAPALGACIEFLTPEKFWTVPLPGYPEIRLALPGPGDIERRIKDVQPDAIHVATEGPLGHAARRVCLQHDLPLTTSFHTRFPDYLAQRLPVPKQWTSDLAWRWLRRFHSTSAAILAATPSLCAELSGHGLQRVKLWPRGVDIDEFRPRARMPLGLRRPVFLTVGRLAVEKNLEAFLSLDLPGTKVVVGEGPARAQLERQFPDAIFVGARHGEALAKIYAAADVFVFPSRTDTFGLVMLEALASGTPVAAFPAAAPCDVIGEDPVGCLDEDLHRACLGALECSREDCREFAQRFTWTESARAFVGHISDAASSRRQDGQDRAAIAA